MRRVSAEVIGENLEVETIPLTFKLKAGGEEILPAPIAFAPNLWAKVEDVLNHSDDSTHGYMYMYLYVFYKHTSLIVAFLNSASIG